MGLAQQYYFPIAWICDVLEKKVDIKSCPEKSDYTMTECADIRHVLTRRMGFIEWFKDYKKCSDYALKFKGDMKPARKRYFYYVCQFFKGKKL